MFTSDGWVRTLAPDGQASLQLRRMRGYCHMQIYLVALTQAPLALVKAVIRHRYSILSAPYLHFNFKGQGEVTQRDLALAVSMVRMGPKTLATIMTHEVILHSAQRSQI